MKYGVSPRTLLYSAGILWLVAGANVFNIGLLCWMKDTEHWTIKLAEASLVFVFFFGIIFNKLYNKHSVRISNKSHHVKHSPLSFFDIKGWVIMAFMITLGVVVRKYNLMPIEFIAVFYTGLALALMATGVRFTYKGIKLKKKLND